MKFKYIFAIILSVLLFTACENSDNSSQDKEEMPPSTTAASPFATNAVATTIDITTEDDILEEPPLPGFSFDFSRINNKTFQYSGEKISFPFTIRTSAADCDYSISLICDNMLVPFSLDGGEQVYSQNISCKNGEERTIEFEFEPCGKKGETVNFIPVVLCDLNSPTLGKYEIPTLYCAEGPFTSFHGEIVMNVEGIEAGKASENVELSDTKQFVLDYYEELDATTFETLEDGTQVRSQTLKDQTVIELYDKDNTVNFAHYFVYNEKAPELNFFVAGKPTELTVFCWSDKGYLPVFDGEYAVKINLPDYGKQATVNCKLDDVNISDVNLIKIIALTSDGEFIITSTVKPITEETYAEFKAWSESL